MSSCASPVAACTCLFDDFVETSAVRPTHCEAQRSYALAHCSRLCAPVLALCGPAQRRLGNTRHARQRDHLIVVTRSRDERICGMPERHLHECDQHRSLQLQRRHFRSCAEPLCARMRVRTGGFGGSRRGAIATGASRHHDTDTTAPVRALHLVMHKMRILLSGTG